jgi:hypothetical protein
MSSAAASLSNFGWRVVTAKKKRSDPRIQFLDDVPEAEEPISPAEEQGLREAKAQAERGETVPLDELRRELG